jgi:xylose isomerase
LKEKAKRFDADKEIQAALAVARVPDLATPTAVGDGSAEALRTYVKTLDEGALGRAHYGHEQLDQLVTELLLGIR